MAILFCECCWYVPHFFFLFSFLNFNKLLLTWELFTDLPKISTYVENGTYKMTLLLPNVNEQCTFPLKLNETVRDLINDIRTEDPRINQIVLHYTDGLRSFDYFTPVVLFHRLTLFSSSLVDSNICWFVLLQSVTFNHNRRLAQVRIHSYDRWNEVSRSSSQRKRSHQFFTFSKTSLSFESHLIFFSFLYSQWNSFWLLIIWMKLHFECSSVKEGITENVLNVADLRNLMHKAYYQKIMQRLQNDQRHHMPYRSNKLFLFLFLTLLYPNIVFNLF